MPFHASRHSLETGDAAALTLSPIILFRFARNCKWGKLLLFLLINRLCHKYN